MKPLFFALLLATFATAVAKADEVTITLDPASQTAVAGGTLEFFGTLTNDTNATIFLNGDTLNLNGASFPVTDQFFNTVPISLAPSGQSGDTSGSIELFDVTTTAPLSAATGSYVLLGGADFNAQDTLGSADFAITTASPVPEPSSIYLLLTGLSATLLPASRRLRSRA